MNSNRLDNIFLQLKRMVGIIEKDIIKEISDMDIGNLTLAEIGIMDAIGLNSEKTIKEIAQQLEVAVSTPTKTMDRLVKKGYIVRTTSDEDRRMVVSTLTEKGYNALIKITTMRQKKILQLTEKLSCEEVNQLLLTLNKLM
ncbi:MarR family transcriptional regulator [Clostridium sp. 'deep sea']|uniref:MarR family winged helix-turn-helix transcriptional regulator n=1 Tax=Clostridium sp. 'deep sea' TaxID=2779445 RepID=UPI001896710C|nr:MarR family transcriptional regulator [Clostridium sp. 'deep sea']QOR35066.1 MarR family transcriptional regulator [Clostridium sp. 'deep sea']